MSTRSTINFCYGKEVEAKIYRHSDGYPEGVLPDLNEFFAAVKEGTDDTRFNDPSYLAAKYIVWQAKQYTQASEWRKPKSDLDFIGLGVLSEDPGGIEYTYFLDCRNLTEGYPTVTYNQV